MYIRRTKTKSGKDGKSYFTYRLVESIRTEAGVRQNTIMNLGRHFPYPREAWPDICCRIRDILSGQMSLFELPTEVEKAAQCYAGKILHARGKSELEHGGSGQDRDYQTVDLNSLELTRPRSVGAEHVALQALRRLGIDRKLDELRFNRHQKNAAIGMIIGRMIDPGSELATKSWLADRSGLGELIDYDFEEMSLSRTYRASDMLLKHKEELESFVYERQKLAFKFEETITLYDLTNTYFEGQCKRNGNAAFGRSKEKRTDCLLVTLALVLDSSGFPKRSEVFEGNASEPKTLKQMISGLGGPAGVRRGEKKQGKLFGEDKPLIVMDAGIATEENVQWLREKGFRYLVVSRKRSRELPGEGAVEVKNVRDYRITVRKAVNEKTGETELHCHSTRKERKEKAISDKISSRLVSELEKLNEGFSKKGCLKKHDKVMEKIGRLKQKYSKASKRYDIKVKRNSKSGNAEEVSWSTKEANDDQDSNPGTYCLRTNWGTAGEVDLWRTYTMLTDLEAVFRSLKSELGLRPVFHQKTDRVSGHLFITVLAYHLVHNIRRRLKECEIHSSWNTLRKQLSGQCRITTTMNKEDGGTIHVRKASRPEPMQKVIYEALGISLLPGKTIKTTI